MAEYVSVDDNLRTCKDLSEDSIVNDIIAARLTEVHSDTDNSQIGKTAAEPPSVESALAA